MLRPFGFHLAALFGLIGAALAPQPAEAQTYTGMFADGTYVTAGKITEWNQTTAPKLNGRALLDPAKPIRWLKNESAEIPIAPKAYVEMFGGDRLPGTVVEYRYRNDAAGERHGAHLAVKTEGAFDGPDQTPREHLRVRLSQARRIVWQRRSRDRYTPSTLYYADGREASFRSIRWNIGSVTLLLKEETRKVVFGEIAELHLPLRDPWEVYYETLAVLSPDGQGRLLRIETFGGLVATTSLARLQAKAVSGDPAGWFHIVQPAWSIDPLWVRHVQVQWRRLTAPHEVPLSVIEPQRAEQVSSFGGGWTWQVDRSVRGETLTCGGKTFGWGLGVPAYCELEFPLPELVVTFRTRLGLDESVGGGGCVRGKICLNSTSGKPAYESKTLVGSAGVEDSGAIDLKSVPGGAKRLILVADSNPPDRPAGADPLDIRDMFDWLEPLVELDPGKLQAEVDARLYRAAPAWEGWTATAPAGGKLVLNSRWDPMQSRDLRWRLETGVRGGPLTLSRKLEITPERKFLALATSRLADATTASELEVRIDGKPIARFPVPERRSGAVVDPQLVPLDKFTGRSVAIEIVCTPKDEKSLVEWRSVDFTEYSTPTPWISLAPREVKADGKSSLKIEPDQGVFSTGTLSADVFTVVADTELQGITAIRLEAIADPRLPGRGPGRLNDGGFMISSMKVTAAPLDDLAASEPVELAEAAADSVLDPSCSAAKVIDAEAKSFWSPRRDGQSHVLVLTTAGDLGFPAGTRLTIKLDQAMHMGVLGRFRLSATNVVRPVPVERPGTIVQLLE